MEIQKAWDTFHASAKKVQTKSGKDATFFPPWLPWYLVKEGDNLVAIHLNWCPFYVWKLCRGRHPSAANDDNGILYSATWELWRSALGDGHYAQCIKVNACPIVFDYSGDVLDIYDQDELDKINSLYRIFIENFMTVVTKNALCSKGVVARYIVETIINILKPRNNPTGRRDLALQQGASMDVNDALRTAITEFNQGEKSLEEFRVFFVKKNKTFAEPEHAGLKVFNLFTETSNSKISAKLNSIAKHSSVKNLIKGFLNVNLKDAENFIGHKVPNSLTMYKLVLPVPE